MTEINSSLKSTEINTALKSTEINKILARKTEINNELTNAIASEISAGTVLSGGYEIIGSLSVVSGEADLYICEKNGENYVAKFYKRKQAVKSEVIEKLKHINSPYVASPIESAIYGERTYEILPYYKNGSLQGKIFSFKELKENIIPCVNEALNILHQNDIIHKDLKPSNIMLLDDNKSVAVIDFGISSVVKDGNSILLTKTGLTLEYSAPEALKGVFSAESDYYSFGITLYELFCGQTPYKNMTNDEILQLTSVQRIPFPKNIPDELKDLISALTYNDITNRKDKNNPDRRWIYKEVCNWCNGVEQAIPGRRIDTTSSQHIMPYRFLGKNYDDLPSLVKAFAENWEDGKKQLYRGIMTEFFKGVNPEIAGYCMDAEEAISKNENLGDITYLNLLYKIDPKLKGIYWKGKHYESSSALGKDMMEKLWKNLEDSELWGSMLEQGFFSEYFKRIKENNYKRLKDNNLKDVITDSSDIVSNISTMEFNYNKDLTSREKKKIYYSIAYLLTGQNILYVDNSQFKTVSELANYMKELLNYSYQGFEYFCRKMIDGNSVLDPQLEAWLIALGKKREIEEWRRQLSK